MILFIVIAFALGLAAKHYRAGHSQSRLRVVNDEHITANALPARSPAKSKSRRAKNSKTTLSVENKPGADETPRPIED